MFNKKANRPKMAYVPIISENTGPIFAKFSSLFDIFVWMINLVFFCECSRNIAVVSSRLKN